MNDQVEDRFMLKRVLAAILLVSLFWAAQIAKGQEQPPLTITGGDPKIVKVDRLVIVKEDRLVMSSFPFFINGTPDFALYFWTFPPELSVTDQANKLRVNAAPNGTYTISVKEIGADWAAKKFITQFRSVTFTIGDVKPDPNPPKPDPPKPDPPKPDVSPISEPGFRVLIVYETAEVTPTLDNIISGEAIKNYTTAKCAKDGTTPAFRALDKDAGASMDFKWVHDAMKRQESGVGPDKTGKRTALPWIIVSNPGVGGFEGPLPATVADTLALLKKFGG